LTTEADAAAIMSDLQRRVRERLRYELLRDGTSTLVEDPELFADVERLLRRAAGAGDADSLLVAAVLGDPATWRLQTALHYRSHRGRKQAAFILFIKRRVLMPMFRWLFEYSRDNFDRQRRVNHVLFACVQELAAETARLRQQLQQLPPGETRPGSDPTR
jgi:hypothetical protein